MLTDDRILARQSVAAGGLEVLAQRLEVMWSDGTSVVLHPIQANRLPMLTLRAVALPCGMLLLVDLAKMVRRLDAELRTCPARDVPGHVFFTLRQAYGNAGQFVADARRKALGWWQVVEGGNVWLAAPRAVDAATLSTADLSTRPTAPGNLWCPS